MKYIKTFELNEDKPKVGDYVISTDKKSSNNELRNYLINTIGKIYDIYNNSIYVMYENIPIKLKKSFYNGFDNNTMRFDKNEILHFGEKSEMERILTENKFNL